MDAQAELTRERAVLVKSDADIRRGEERVVAQAKLIADLRAKSLDGREAAKLLALLRETLHQWREHHVLIQGRIAYLEHKLASAEPDHEPGDEVMPR